MHRKVFKTKKGERHSIEFEKYNYNNVLSPNINRKQILSEEMDSILKDCWGLFPSDFIEKHIFDEKCRIIIAKHSNEFIGFCVLSLRNISEVNVHYVEFLAIKRNFQNFGLGPYLFYLIIYEDIKRNFLKLLFEPIEIMFITPNTRALMRMAKFASFIYPNPYLADNNGTIPQADDLTWKMAQGLIDSSDKPDRKLYREGLVLEGSYAETPWLI